MTGLLALLAIIGIPALIAASAMWRGYVLSIIWAWFIVPQFGLPTLSIPDAIGVALVVGCMTSSSNSMKERDWSDAILRAALEPAIVLLFGWIVTKFL